MPPLPTADLIGPHSSTRSRRSKTPPLHTEFVQAVEKKQVVQQEVEKKQVAQRTSAITHLEQHSSRYARPHAAAGGCNGPIVRRQ
jgi:hypothetical protein